MRVDSNSVIRLLAAITASLLVASTSLAVTVGEDDFDGSLTAGASFSTNPVDPGLNGLFSAGASRFDRWGVANRATLDSAGPGLQALPFDLVDESVTAAAGATGGPFAADDIGIIKGTKTDNFFAIGDLENAENPSGTGTATWSFDISGFSNLNVSIDWAAIGVFIGTGDTIDVIATIDDEAPQLIMDGDGNTGAAYTVTMEGGVTYDRYQDPFWNATSDALWGILTTPGQTVPFNNGSDVIDWSIDDLNQDGFNDISLEKTFQETNSFGTFQEAEAHLYTDPMTINGVALNNEFQTISAPVAGTGSTLELTISVAQNGSVQFITFDNLLIEGDLGLVGDYDGDGFVGQADLDLVLLNWGDTVPPDPIPDGWVNQQPTGLIGQTALDGVLLNWGNGSPPSVASVPEPTSAVILLIGTFAGTHACRRQRF